MIRYARGTSKFDAHPAIREVPDFAAFERAVLADRARAKGQQYICAPLKPNGDGRPHRGKDGVEPRRFLAIDVDRIAGAETFAEFRLWLARFNGFGFTTASSTQDAPRCRVILETDREIDRTDGIRLGAAIARDIGEAFGDLVQLDESTHRGEQPCYCPVRESEAFRLGGDPLDVDALLETAPPVEPERKGSAAIDPGDDPVLVAVKERAMYRRDLGAGRHAVRCPWEGEHPTEDDENSTATCYMQPHHAGFVTAGFRCLHAHCTGRKGEDLLGFLGIDWRTVRDAYGGRNGTAETAQGAPDWTGEVPPPEGTADAPRGAPAPLWPAPIDLAALAELEPVHPRHIVPAWLPEGEVTLFAGHGGAGKSALALQLAACIALPMRWCGLDVEHRPAYFISCEDGRDILHWRMGRIARHLGVQVADFAGRLHLIDASAIDPELMIDPGRGDEPMMTARYAALAERIEPGAVIVIDGSSDVFGASEIVRRHVRRFVRALRRLAGDSGAVLLLAHVDKAAARNKDGGDRYSGSTAWHNSVRARWELQADGDDLVLKLAKANHARAGAEIRLRWDDAAHMHLPVDGAADGGVVASIRERQNRDGLVAAIRACVEPIPAAMTGPRTGWHVLIARPELPAVYRDSKVGRRQFWAEIERLRAMGIVRTASIRRSDRHYREVIELVPEGRGECGQC